MRGTCLLAKGNTSFTKYVLDPLGGVQETKVVSHTQF